MLSSFYYWSKLKLSDEYQLPKIIPLVRDECRIVWLQNLYSFDHNVLFFLSQKKAFLPHRNSTFSPWRQPLIYPVFLVGLRTMLWTSLKNWCVTKLMALSPHLLDKMKRAVKMGLDCLRNKLYGSVAFAESFNWAVVD